MATTDIAPPDPGSIAAAHAPPVSPSRRAPSVVVLTLLALMVLAVVIRAPGLRGPDGQLNTDEARLTLAADGVLQHGYPVMPSGRVYTRGLMNAYLIGGSFALFGRHDFAARLPSVLAGTLLVPVVYLLGQAFSSGGRGRVETLSLTGLTAATFVALAEPLAYYSASAWLPSIFLLLFIWAIYCCYRGFVGGQERWQVAGALSFWIALLSYEFTVLLLAGLGLYLLYQVVRGRWGWYRGRATLLALGLFLAGLALFAGLALVLRSGTLAGAYGEIRNFVSPTTRLQGLNFYVRYLLADYLVLLAALALALPLLVISRPRGTLFLGLLMALSFLVPSLLIQVQRSPRYALPVLPLLAVLAAESTIRLARWAGPRLGAPQPLRLALPAGAAVLIFGLALAGDVRAALRHLGEPPPGPTWVQALQQQGLQPDDLILAESANKVHYYLGRADFYIRPDDYERYAYRADDTLRYLYTGAALVLNRGDFERLVEGPNPGRAIWIVGRADRLPDRAATLDPTLWPSLLDSAEQRVDTADGWLLLKLRLPRQVRPG